MKIRKMLFGAAVLASLVFAVSCADSPSGTSDNTSGSLDLASLSVTPGTLDPAFDKDVINYAVSVANSVTNVRIDATAVDKFAGVGMDATNPITLAEGSTVFTVTVAAADYDYAHPDPAKIKRYYITITRAADK